MTSDVEPVVEGAWDTHVHAGPDAIERKLDVRTLAIEASKAEMGGLVVKNHEYPTTMLTRLVAAQSDVDLELVGTAVLNETLGGLNPATVDVAADFGTKRMELPTKSAASNMLDQGRRRYIVVAEDGSLTAAARAVLDAGIEHDMVVGTGHIGVEEVRAVVDYVTARDGTVLVTHPELHRARDGVGMSPEVQAEIATEGVYFERCGIVFQDGITDHLLPEVSRSTIEPAFETESMREYMLAGIDAVGVERNVVSTDLGQPHNTSPPAGLVDFHERLLSAGVSEQDLSVMARDVPRQCFDVASE